MLSAVTESNRAGGYGGLRLTAAEFFSLPDDGRRYELVDGVVVMSPSPTPRHQLVAKVLLRALDEYVEQNQLGLVLYETDVHLDLGPDRPDVVYRPEIIFIRSENIARIGRRIAFPPDLVVEVVSPDYRGFDAETKHDDYRQAAVREYWLIDPEADRLAFFQLDADRYLEMPLAGPEFHSAAIPGFRLSITTVRDAFTMLG